MGNMRKSKLKRKTSETDITVSLDLDGSGISDIATGIGFFDHMLDHVARHGSFDLTISAVGDTHVDFHHTVEDIGITFGKVFREALGEKKGILRYGHSVIPMDEALAYVTIDLSGRPMLIYENPLSQRSAGSFALDLIPVFLQGFVDRSGMTMHVTVKGENPHHVAEAIFKSLGRTLRQAVSADSKQSGYPSTKGILE
jgi:imidazoleglycerol-phosphate dehydratase